MDLGFEFAVLKFMLSLRLGRVEVSRLWAVARAICPWGTRLSRSVFSVFMSLQMAFAANAERLTSADQKRVADFQCPDLLANTGLSAGQAQSILNAIARSQELQFRVLSRKVDGKIKSVVLLGEVHMPLRSDLDAARGVIPNFETALTENGKTNTDPAYTYIVMPIVGALLLPGLLLKYMEKNRILVSPMDLPLTTPGVRSVRSAELGHRPSVSEEATLLGTSILQASDLACKATCVLYSAFSLTDIKAHFLTLALSGGYYLFSKFVLNPTLMKNAFRLPTVKNRDRTMAKNVNDFLNDSESLLVIVGAAHLRNMTNFLINEYGFTETKLEKPANPY